MFLNVTGLICGLLRAYLWGRCAFHEVSN